MPFPKDAVSRTRIGLLGIDMLTIRGAAAVSHAIKTGELVRVSDSVPKPDDLAFPFSWFFPLTRFFSLSHGYFLPFRGESNPTFAPCKAYLESRLKKCPSQVSEHAKHAAQLIKDPSKLPNDLELSATLARAIACRFTADGKVPDDIIRAGHAQVGELTDSFKPWVFIPGKWAIASVYSFFEKQVGLTTEGQSLPKETAPDAAHSVLAPMLHGAAVLREMAKNPDEEIESIFARLGRVEQLPRMVVRETTLGGLVPEDDPVVPGRTMVFINLRQAAKETGDVAWAFGTGTEHRRCTAEKQVLEFFREVQEEVKKLRACD